jgi:hypothetical protein
MVKPSRIFTVKLKSLFLLLAFRCAEALQCVKVGLRPPKLLGRTSVLARVRAVLARVRAGINITAEPTDPTDWDQQEEWPSWRRRNEAGESSKLPNNPLYSSHAATLTLGRVGVPAQSGYSDRLRSLAPGAYLG